MGSEELVSYSNFTAILDEKYKISKTVFDQFAQLLTSDRKTFSFSSNELTFFDSLSSLGPCAYVLHSAKHIEQSSLRYGGITTDLANRIRGHFGANQATSATPYIKTQIMMSESTHFAYVTAFPLSSTKDLIPLEQLVILYFHCNVNKNLLCSGGGRTKPLFVYVKDEKSQNITLAHVFPSIASAQTSLFAHENASVIKNLISHSGSQQGGWFRQTAYFSTVEIPHTELNMRPVEILRPIFRVLSLQTKANGPSFSVSVVNQKTEEKVSFTSITSAAKFMGGNQSQNPVSRGSREGT